MCVCVCVCVCFSFFLKPLLYCGRLPSSVILSQFLFELLPTCLNWNGDSAFERSVIHEHEDGSDGVLGPPWGLPSPAEPHRGF